MIRIRPGEIARVVSSQHPSDVRGRCGRGLYLGPNGPSCGGGTARQLAPLIRGHRPRAGSGASLCDLTASPRAQSLGARRTTLGAAQSPQRHRVRILRRARVPWVGHGRCARGVGTGRVRPAKVMPGCRRSRGFHIRNRFAGGCSCPLDRCRSRLQTHLASALKQAPAFRTNCFDRRSQPRGWCLGFVSP